MTPYAAGVLPIAASAGYNSARAGRWPIRFTGHRSRARVFNRQRLPASAMPTPYPIRPGCSCVPIYIGAFPMVATASWQLRPAGIFLRSIRKGWKWVPALTDRSLLYYDRDYWTAVSPVPVSAGFLTLPGDAKRWSGAECQTPWRFSDDQTRSRQKPYRQYRGGPRRGGWP